MSLVFTVSAVVFLVSARLQFSYEDAVAVAFASTGRDFEIAIVGPLVER